MGALAWRRSFCSSEEPSNSNEIKPAFSQPNVFSSQRIMSTVLRNKANCGTRPPLSGRGKFHSTLHLTFFFPYPSSCLAHLIPDPIAVLRSITEAAPRVFQLNVPLNSTFLRETEPSTWKMTPQFHAESSPHIKSFLRGISPGSHRKNKPYLGISH